MTTRRYVYGMTIVAIGALGVTVVSPTAQRRTAGAVLTLTVTDFVSQSPIAAASVKMLSAGRVFAQGITDGAGVFSGDGAPLRGDVLIEFQQDGYVRHPEQQSVTMDTADKKVSGTLLRQAGPGDYVIRIPGAIRTAAAKAGSSEHKLKVFQTEWDRITLLPDDAQKLIGNELLQGEGKTYLAELPSFQRIVKMNMIGL